MKGRGGFDTNTCMREEKESRRGKRGRPREGEQKKCERRNNKEKDLVTLKRRASEARKWRSVSEMMNEESESM
jgi:hypothetical protein